MLTKTSEVKVMRDPIHGYIHVDLQVIWDCINAREFQRLRRIHQLGGDFQVYHTAEHTRFSHSLGVYEIVRRMVSEIPALSASLSLLVSSKEQKILGLSNHRIGDYSFPINAANTSSNFHLILICSASYTRTCSTNTRSSSFVSVFASLY